MYCSVHYVNYTKSRVHLLAVQGRGGGGWHLHFNFIIRVRSIEKTLPSRKCEQFYLTELWDDLTRMDIFRTFLLSSRNMQILSLKMRTCFYFLGEECK